MRGVYKMLCLGVLACGTYVVYNSPTAWFFEDQVVDALTFGLTSLSLTMFCDKFCNTNAQVEQSYDSDSGESVDIVVDLDPAEQRRRDEMRPRWDRLLLPDNIMKGRVEPVIQCPGCYQAWDSTDSWETKQVALQMTDADHPANISYPNNWCFGDDPRHPDHLCRDCTRASIRNQIGTYMRENPEDIANNLIDPSFRLKCACRGGLLGEDMVCTLMTGHSNADRRLFEQYSLWYRAKIAAKERNERLAVLAAVADENKPNYRICPHDGYAQECPREAIRAGTAACLKCDLQFCTRETHFLRERGRTTKYGGSHDGRSCRDAEEDLRETRDYIFRQIRRGDIKPCPKCKAPISKNEGCKHMTCGQNWQSGDVILRRDRCHHQFCWFCMKPWNRGGLFRLGPQGHNLHVRCSPNNAMSPREILRRYPPRISV